MTEQELNEALELAKSLSDSDYDGMTNNLSRALLQVHGELEQAKQENEDLNGYAEAAQMFAKERDQLQSQLSQANATAEKYRSALKEIANTTCTIGCLDGRTVCDACIAKDALNSTLRIPGEDEV